MSEFASMLREGELSVGGPVVNVDALGWLVGEMIVDEAMAPVAADGSSDLTPVVASVQTCTREDLHLSFPVLIYHGQLSYTQMKESKCDESFAPDGCYPGPPRYRTTSTTFRGYW
jgi:hypothetical protein